MRWCWMEKETIPSPRAARERARVVQLKGGFKAQKWRKIKQHASEKRLSIRNNEQRNGTTGSKRERGLAQLKSDCSRGHNRESDILWENTPMSRHLQSARQSILGHQSKLFTSALTNTFSGVIRRLLLPSKVRCIQKCIFSFTRDETPTFYICVARAPFFECQKHDRKPPYYCHSAAMQEGGGARQKSILTDVSSNFNYTNGSRSHCGLWRLTND